jgi:GGDEF domain-containing protein
MPDSLTSSEHTRLIALESLGVLDTPAEQRVDRFTRLAAMTFGVPIALVSLVDQNRQWFKSRCGLDVAETPRSMAFCSHAVELGDMLVIEDAAADVVNRVSRQGRGTALLYLDIDHFKQINDRHGHAVGDAVLVEFARRLGAPVRSSDLVARKILASMQAPFALGSRTLQVGTSIGAALAGETGPAPARLTEAADRALYAAKQAGRNTIAMVRLGRERVEPPALAHG